MKPADESEQRHVDGIDIGHLVPVEFATLKDELAAQDAWLIEPILPARRSTAIVAAAGLGKSLLALDLTASLATGRAVCERPAGSPLHVVYVDMEMTHDDLAERLDDLGYDYTIDIKLQEHLHYYLLADFAPFDTDRGGDELLGVVERHAAAAVVIDTLARVVDGPENEADTYRDFDHHTGKRLKASGVTALRLDHEGKTKEKGARGSSAKRDDVDVEWSLSVKMGGNVVLDLKKGRSRWIPSKVILTRTDGPLRHKVVRPSLTAKQQKLVGHLDELGIDPDVSRREAKNLLSDAGVSFSNGDYGPAQRERERARRTSHSDHAPAKPATPLPDEARTTPVDRGGPLLDDPPDPWPPLEGGHSPSPVSDPERSSSPVDAEDGFSRDGTERKHSKWDELMDLANQAD